MIASATIRAIVLARALASLRVDDELVLGQELVGYLYGTVEVAAGVVAQVDDEALEVALLEFGQGNEQFGVGGLTKVLDADVAGCGIHHVSCRDALLRNLAARDREGLYRLRAITDDTNLHLGVFGSLQAMLCLFIGYYLPHKGLTVHADNFVTRQDAGSLGRPILDDVLHVDSILPDGELDADTRERTAQVVVCCLHVFGVDVDRVGIELREYLGDGVVHQ